MTKKKRGTAIVQTSKGILLTKMKGDLFLLPGGKTEPGEPRIITAIRELKEETNLSAESVIFLFEHESQHYNHKVFLIKATGTPKASNEIILLDYYPNVSGDLISDSSLKIIHRFTSTPS
ncbi:MAG: NUDIX domain-containing protein [Methylovulum sp.]|jgi:8-oxo-dGTP pyrophosphatase MutT (NUDIX family)|nr:NUDIX domain-containing protein [Methylovulum sp.]